MNRIASGTGRAESEERANSVLSNRVPVSSRRIDKHLAAARLHQSSR